MAEFTITRSGLSSPTNATARPYDRVHLSDFMDVWLPRDAAFGVDHLIYEDGEIELRIQGDRLSEIL